jgi:malate synthase
MPRRARPGRAAASPARIAMPSSLRAARWQLVVTLEDGSETGLASRSKFAGYQGDAGSPRRPAGQQRPAPRNPDRPRATRSARPTRPASRTCWSKPRSPPSWTARTRSRGRRRGQGGRLRNWLGLMRGDLVDSLREGRQDLTRRLNADQDYTAPDGGSLTLRAAALMFVRNVGHLMTNPAVLARRWHEVPEGILDAVSPACRDARPATRRRADPRNSRSGSVYIVKPKMHGPDEVAFTSELFGRVEDLLGLPATPQDGHHGRGAPHLAQPCRLHRRGRLARGVHQHRLPRPHRRRDPHRDGSRADDPQGRHEGSDWISAYERNNVQVGLACGLRARRRSARACGRCPT